MHFRHESIVGAVREIIFGLEDSLVSTLGAVTGIAVGTGNQFTIVLSGLVILVVEAVSMAAGSYFSTETVEFVEEGSQKTRLVRRLSLRAAGIMFFFYLIGGLAPLLPYFFLKPSTAIYPSVICTAVVLALIGCWAGKIAKRPIWRAASEMVVVSLSAAAVGYVIGRFAPYFLNV